MRARTADDLTFAELAALEAFGIGEHGEPFPSLAAARRAWREHGDYLVERARERRPGGRPVAFWLFEARRPDLLGDPDDWRTWDALEPARIAFLRKRGLLSPEEESAIAAEAREEEARAAEDDDE